ncbi:hypothetical protein MG293_013054 [Ovis ammon polii]|uniref:PR domain zinc finger protein 16 n=1 Tax=Ovis ammon polii TaxID=230172 RepID=A0AAD4U1P1_OVIAM|nr:hypothetical protein MG293_013054 [Ovis ammon polii]KAI4563163.1 hypothetical protein MJT46_010772 [Ovis ammon polii x Ovis aries]
MCLAELPTALPHPGTETHAGVGGKAGRQSRGPDLLSQPENSTGTQNEGDGDIVNNMYGPDPDLLAGESAEDETEDSIMSPIPMGPPSPFPTPKEGSPYEAPVYIPEDIRIPPGFELRESSIPGAGLGIWAKKKMEVGERFGPYMVAPRATLNEADFGWEILPVSAPSLINVKHGIANKGGILPRPFSLIHPIVQDRFRWLENSRCST